MNVRRVTAALKHGCWHNNRLKGYFFWQNSRYPLHNRLALAQWASRGKTTQARAHAHARARAHTHTHTQNRDGSANQSTFWTADSRRAVQNTSYCLYTHFKTIYLRNKWRFFVRYLDYGVSPGWTGFPGNPGHPSPPYSPDYRQTTLLYW
jgi:hypothetical protein